MTFWNKLKKPFFVLAPMADVTDPAFRRIIAKYGKPDVLWTEFVSADGLFMGGYDALVKDLAFSEEERPIVAQFFTSKPEIMERAAKLAVELGFDGIDINMGCPDKSIEKQSAGAKLMTNPKLAQEIILSAMKGAGDLPVSVKTRIGWNKNELETWLPALLETNPAAITVHARTRKELSLVPARWEHVKRAVEIRDNFINSQGEKSKTLIIGNGDVKDLDDAKAKAEETGCDGVMLGRAIFGNPWLFANLSHAKHGRQIEHPAEALAKVDISIEDKLKVLVEHTKLFEKLLPQKSFAVMKKHYKAYVTGWHTAKELRMKLMEAGNTNEVEQVVDNYLENSLK
jgi:nifR3 family TIM-barrel protein